MSAAIPEFVEQLIVDGTKVGFWPERVEAWRRGERVAPITVDCAMTRRCNFACHFCYAQLQANEDEEVTRDQFFDFLDDCAEIGVRGVSFISDGESTMVPWYADAVEHAHALGLKVGAGSNGLKLTKDVLERVLPRLSYLRFNLSGGERKRYSEIMGVRQHVYDLVVQNVRDAMAIVHRDSLAVTVNMQLVLHPKDGDQILPFARLAAELRPTYAVIKHCSDGDEGQLGVAYDEYANLEADLLEAEKIGRDAGVRITAKWDRIKSKCGRTYDACHGPNFIMQVSGSGLVAPCGMMFNDKWTALHIGNITRTRFRDLWKSDRWQEVMGYIGGEHWDSRVRCPPGCLQNPTNEWLYRYVNGRIALPTTSPPPHLEFI